MEIGVIFPQTEIEPDPSAVRDFAQAAQDMGYSYLFVADHVLGADPDHHDHPAYAMYNQRSVVHESLTLMGYLAAVAPGLGLATGILILPQRQTALVAKQAAEIDVLCGGRLRLGIGVGWNEVEYQALGMNFHDRGARSAEQIRVMRELWTKEVVDFHGRWHDITHAGINPLPVQRPIPVWLGVGSPWEPTPPDTAFRRVASLADGWCPNFVPDANGQALVDKVNGFMAEYDRDPSSLGLDGRLKTAGSQPKSWIEELDDWRKLGASYVSLENRRAGLGSADEHIEAMRRFKEAAGF